MVDLNPDFRIRAGDGPSGPSKESSAQKSTEKEDLFASPRMQRVLHIPKSEDRKAHFSLDGEIPIEPNPKVAKTINTISDYSKKSVSATTELLRSAITQFKSGFETLAEQPSVVSWGAGIGAALFGLFGLKNFFHGLSVALGRRMDQVMPSIAYFFQSFLQLGAAVTGGSILLGKRSPIMTEENGKLVISKKAAAGVVLAPLGLSAIMKVAQGALSGWPLIGGTLEYICAAPFKAIKGLFKDTKDEIPTAAGMGGAAPAMAH